MTRTAAQTVRVTSCGSEDRNSTNSNFPNIFRISLRAQEQCLRPLFFNKRFETNKDESCKHTCLFAHKINSNLDTSLAEFGYYKDYYHTAAQKKMKILYISNDPGIPLNGRKGCSTHVRETCRSLINAGHDTLVSIPVIGEDKSEKPIDFIIPPLFSSKKLGFDLRLFFSNFIQKKFYEKIISDFKPDAIYERYSLYSWIGGKIAEKYNIPRILEINAPLARQHSDRLRFKGMAQKIEERILRKADAVIAISEPLKKYLIEIGVSHGRITVMPIAVDPELFSPKVDGNEVRKQYGLAGKTVFGYVGAFNYYHGIDNLYDLAEHFKAKKLDALLLIVGGEDYKVAKHIEKLKELNLTDYVKFTGSVRYETLPSYVAAMDITLIFGHTNYASPTKLFEYASMEKPIIAPDFPPIKAILNQGEESSHFIFNPDDIKDLIEKADYLYNNPQIRKVLTKKIKDIVLLEHTWESNTNKVLEIFSELINQRQKKS